MIQIRFLAISLCVLQQIVVQAELVIKYDDCVIVSMNPEYYDNEKSFVYIVEDDEANKVNVSLTIIKSMPVDTEVTVKMLGLSMGQYRVSTGVGIKLSLCDIFDEPIVFAPLLAGMGFPADDCPAPPGTYSAEDLPLKMEDLPDDFPENKYLVEMEMVFENKTIIKTKIFIDVTTI